ncbi:DNA primase [Thalassovita sp.]|uniref:DNA primase n=1 Tax=Thalassovita sp. TaxID=1979401 RepID=UPI0029DE5102|nr:DNA primase [Thalassovita sp.]
MSLPPGFLDELRSRTSLSQVVGRKVMWDSRKSNQGKGDMWAPCPFHQEKSASFHVDDRKGFYYCFGCHAKGDAISFVQETENVGFMEAIEILAREAGMQVPKGDPRAQQKADRRAQLAEVMEQAVQFYRLQLKRAVAEDARAYLSRRGLAEAAQDRFEIGFAPDGWQALWDHLTGKGVPEDLILGAGLAKPSTKGKRPYDVFRNRIMFPIRDARGRCIAFGGRAMDPNDNAKYLNSPETDLFDKGHSLYNHGPAREASGKGQPLIVAEGYMDVIALSEAGFGATVAPLGTAITDNQLQLLWRISPEPVIALDGDTAGLRAAMRVIDLALPLLEAGRSLRFAIMPEGMDPDDLIRAKGAGAVQKVLDAAIPMVDLLWRRETEGKVFDSPERVAALDRALHEKTVLIRDEKIRSRYDRTIKDYIWNLEQAEKKRGKKFQSGWRKDTAILPKLSTRNSMLVAAGDAAQHRVREAVILATLLRTPAIIREFESQLEMMVCTDPDHALIRDLLLQHAHQPALGGVEDRVSQAMGPGGLETLFAIPHVAIAPSIRRAGDADTARMTVAEELAKMKALQGLTAEIAEAEEEIQGVADEAVTWRLSQAAETRNRALRSQNEDRAEYDVGKNGARINRSERADLDAILKDLLSPGKRR